MRAICMGSSHHLPSRRHGHCLVVHGGLLVWCVGVRWLSLVPEHCHVALCRRKYAVAWGEGHCKKRQNARPKNLNYRCDQSELTMKMADVTTAVF